MKKSIPMLLIVVIALLTGCSENSAVTPESAMPDEDIRLEAITEELSNIAIDSLTPADIAGLQHMREEEKLARDVYLYFADRYTTPIFSNISNSEATHMAAVKLLLDRYGIQDPVVSEVRGVYSDPHFSDLYAQLTAAGDAGLLAALQVGATIEDLDIKDLMDLTSATTALDVTTVYTNLTKASGNHLRSFYGLIVSNNGTWQPTYISQTLFQDIISTSRQRGRR